MKPVFQHKFGSGGSCFTACIASILEVDLKDIPNFVDHGQDWMCVLWKYLDPMGLSYTSHHFRPGEPPKFIPEGYHTISGYAPRGYRHSVVGFRGQFVHDPFPNGGGLITVDGWGAIHPKELTLWTEFSIPYEVK